MDLPINIKEILESKLIEKERLELKKGFNPEKIAKTMCAFANDFNNWGGGYIVLGVEDNKNIVGIDEKQVDFILKKLIGLSNMIRHPYFPIAEPIRYKNKNLILIYCPGGPARPYKAPSSFRKGSEYKYYIRRNASTVAANHEEEKELIGMSNRIPFDDQTNYKAELEDLNIHLIKSYLKEVGSKLNPTNLDMIDLFKSLNIVGGPDEYLKPKNIGLLMFSSEPKRFIKTPWIEVTIFFDEVGDNFEEEIFEGDIYNQLKSALKYLNNNVIRERVQKVSGQAEAKRYFSYPYEAIEEALVNAVYHKSYEIEAPIEVRVEQDRIDIISYPGPLPPLNKDNINDKVVISKKYRNRRIGDFLKELKLTEGKNTGFKKIRKSLEANGSPEPEFITDDDRVYFVTRLRMHKHFDIVNDKNVGGNVGGKMSRNERQDFILNALSKNPKLTINTLAEKSGVNPKTIERDLNHLRDKVKFIGHPKSGYWKRID